MILHYPIADVAPYINWIYFFHAWGSSQMPQQDRAQLQHEAEERLDRYSHTYRTHAVFQLFDAYSEDDDIVVGGGRRVEGGGRIVMRLPLAVAEAFMNLPSSPATSNS